MSKLDMHHLHSTTKPNWTPVPIDLTSRIQTELFVHADLVLRGNSLYAPPPPILEMAIMNIFLIPFCQPFHNDDNNYEKDFSIEFSIQWL